MAFTKQFRIERKRIPNKRDVLSKSKNKSILIIRFMKNVRFLMMAITLLFAMSVSTQVVAQNKKKLLKQANKGIGEVQALVSTYYLRGIEGFEKDVEQATFWAKKAEESANAGSVGAQIWMAACLFKGDHLFKKNLDYALQWTNIALKNVNLQSDERERVLKLKQQISDEIEKEKRIRQEEIEKEKKLRQEAADRLAAEKIKRDPIGAVNDIERVIEDKSKPFSEVEAFAAKLMKIDNSEAKNKAIKKLIKNLQTMGTGYDSDKDLYLSYSHEGTGRGRQEMALAAKLQEYLIEGGDMQETINYAYRCRQSGDTKKAIQYFQQAADKGNAMAIRGLALCYEDENNKEKAFEWYTKLLEIDVSEQVAITAMNFFRKINRSDLILNTLEKLAASGNRDGMLRVGDIYRNGHDWSSKETGITVKKNYVTAIKWYKKANEAGSRAALFFMADCYWKGGNGITQNRAQAGKLYQQMLDESGISNVKISQAEKEERSEASYQFGYCLETGAGVVRDINRAWDFYCDSYEADAYYRRAVMLEKQWVKETLWPDARKRECRQLYQKAANKGHAKAKQALNRMYKTKTIVL